MSDSEPEPVLCDHCQTPVSGAMLFLVLYAVSAAETPHVATIVRGGGDNLWETDERDEEGTLLHWPICATDWIEVKMIESGVRNR